jgi:hypothetical protein
MSQVMEIRRNRRDDTELLKDIHVAQDPKFMTDFRSRIWPIIEKNCATANCHGGPEPAGGLRFFVFPGQSVRRDYTNFLIVSGWKNGRSRLLERQNIQSSLILQYGLNRKVSKKWHPGPPITPVFTSIRAANYRRVRDWMASLVKPLAPDYHIHPGYRPAGMTLDTSGNPDMPSESEEKRRDKKSDEE